LTERKRITGKRRTRDDESSSLIDLSSCVIKLPSRQFCYLIGDRKHQEEEEEREKARQAQKDKMRELRLAQLRKEKPNQQWSLDDIDEDDDGEDDEESAATKDVFLRGTWTEFFSDSSDARSFATQLQQEYDKSSEKKQTEISSQTAANQTKIDQYYGVSSSSSSTSSSTSVFSSPSSSSSSSSSSALSSPSRSGSKQPPRFKVVEYQFKRPVHVLDVTKLPSTVLAKIQAHSALTTSAASSSSTSSSSSSASSGFQTFAFSPVSSSSSPAFLNQSTSYTCRHLASNHPETLATFLRSYIEIDGLLLPAQPSSATLSNTSSTSSSSSSAVSESASQIYCLRKAALLVRVVDDDKKSGRSQQFLTDMFSKLSIKK